MPRSGIAELHGSSVSSFLRNPHTVLHSASQLSLKNPFQKGLWGFPALSAGLRAETAYGNAQAFPEKGLSACFESCSLSQASNLTQERG